MARLIKLGLLERWSGNDTYSFQHRTFQEYLAARAIVARGDFERLAHQMPEESSGDSESSQWSAEEGWEEVILLALAMEQETPPGFRRFLRALLKGHALSRNPRLLRECFEDGAQVDVEALIEVMAPEPKPREFPPVVIVPVVQTKGVLERLLSVLQGFFGAGRLRVGKVLEELPESEEKLDLPKPDELPWTERSMALTLLSEQVSFHLELRERLKVQAQGLLQHPPPWLQCLPKADIDVFGTWVRQFITLTELSLSIPGMEPGEVRIHRLWDEDGTILLEMELVWVPSGSFEMGNSELLVEQPVHQVTFEGGFWLGRFPVTNTQYGVFLEAKPKHPKPAYWNDGRFNAPTHPVAGVSWEGAIAFCQWAGLELPSEATWEYAARGPMGWTYPWGNAEPTKHLANFDKNVEATSPVGTYLQSASWVGAQDMAGNVWEWVMDSWHDDYAEAPSDGRVWSENADGQQGVLRGGSWYDDSKWLRGSNRVRDYPGNRSRDYGFRVSAPLSSE